MRRGLLKITVAIIVLFLSFIALSNLMYNFKAIDRDSDGLKDSIEKKIGSDSLDIDSDDDGLNDYEEYNYWNSRSNEELNEIAYQFWYDHWLERFEEVLSEEDFRNKLLPDGDIDNDDKPNICDKDSDDDGLSDGFEIENNTDPAIPNSADLSKYIGSDGGNSGGGGTDPSNSKSTITTVTDISSTAFKTDYFYVEGNIKNEQSQGVANMSVEIFVNKTKNEPGDFAGEGEANSDGYFYIKCEVPEDTEAGVNHILAHAIPNSNNSEYASSWSDPTIEIYSDTRLIFNMADSVGIWLPLLIKGKLVDSDNKSLSNKAINIYIDNEFFVETITDLDGVFRTNHTFNDFNEHSIYAVFEGDEYLNSSDNTKNVTVKDIGTRLEITIDPLIVKRDDQINIDGYLFDGSDNTMSDSQINIYYDENQITTATTKDNGGFEKKVDIGSPAFIICVALNVKT